MDSQVIQSCTLHLHNYFVALMCLVLGFTNSYHLIHNYTCTVYTRVQVEFFGRENGLKKSTLTYIRENMRHTYGITKKCQNSLQQAKLRS